YELSIRGGIAGYIWLEIPILSYLQENVLIQVKGVFGIGPRMGQKGINSLWIIQKVIEDVGEDDDFKSGPWVRVTNYVNTNGGTITGLNMKDLTGTIPGTIHYKVIGEDGYGKDITIGAALILANVSVFSPKPSMHYLNITMRNVGKVFRKDMVPQIM
nr:GPCR kinase [Tanacetum cinerariifolium]